MRQYKREQDIDYERKDCTGHMTYRSCGAFEERLIA